MSEHRAQPFGDQAPPERSNLTHLIIDRIIDLLTSGVLRPGDRLPSIEALTQQFAVGRTSVREALRALELVGIVEIRHGDGTFIREDASRFFLKPLSWGALLDQPRILALAETRRCMESELAAMAALRSSPQGLAVIEERLVYMETQCRQPEAYIAADPQFHLTIWQVAGNEVMLNMLASILDLLTRVVSAAVLGAPGSIEVGLVAHRQIYEAIAARDPEGARFSMRRHLDYVGRLAVSTSQDVAVAQSLQTPFHRPAS